MASYHLSAQIVKRSEGRSVVAMAAYRSGTRLRDERRGVDADYRRKRGIVHSEIMAPDGAAAWLQDRGALWNFVEASEKRKDAQLARELNIALPYELSDDERLLLVRTFVREQFVSRGMVADIALHRPVPEKGDDPRNFHAHILLTMRQAERSGLRRVKTREWNSEKLLSAWRSAWAKMQNETLERGGHLVRVDHRSFLARRADASQRGVPLAGAVFDREPELHVGPKARKAGRGGQPVSRVRKIGPKRRDQQGFSAQREVRYDRLDRGSRGEWNIRRLVGNAERMGKSLAHIERRLLQARMRNRYYTRQLACCIERCGRGGERSWLPSRKAAKPLGVFSVVETQRRMDHYKLRIAQVAWIIEQLDRVFLALLGIREHQLTRRTVWANRLKQWRPRDLNPVRDSGRPRLRFENEETF